MELSGTVIGALYRPGRVVGAAAVCLALGVVAVPAAAQECLLYDPPLLFDTTYNCDSKPEIDRVFGTETIFWKSNEYLVANTGNDLRVWDIDVAGSASVVAYLGMGVTPPGDIDYYLENFTVCNDCRYGVSNFGSGNVLFDLGTGSTPTVAARRMHAGSRSGSFTFKHPDANGQQYLVIDGLTDHCTDQAAVYTFDGIETVDGVSPDLGFATCVEGAGGGSTSAGNGAYLNLGGAGYLFFMDRWGPVTAYRIGGSGASLTLTNLGTFADVDSTRYLGFRVDEDAPGGPIGVSAADGAIRIWDLSDPANISSFSTLNVGGFTPPTAAAISYPFVWATAAGFITASLSYDVTNPVSPAPIDPDFFNNASSWMQHSCAKNYDAEFNSAGTYLYFARYSALQAFDFSACGSRAPTANVSVSPSQVFPGDAATVTDTSSGPQDTEYALWITERLNDDPLTDTVAALCGAGTDTCGSTTFVGARPSALQLHVPIDLDADVEYYYHAAVRTTEYGCDPSTSGGITACGSQYMSNSIGGQDGIDRAPSVSISVSKSEAVIDETVTATAVAEGTPSDPGGGDPFDWTISPPAGDPTPDSEGTIGPITLDQQGDWSFDLTTAYEHEAAGGGSYSFGPTTAVVNVKSVVADLTVSPSSVCADAAVTLNASASRPEEGNLSFAWTITGPSSYSCSGESCVISANSLEPGSYAIEVEVTNNDTLESDTADASLKVNDCSVQLEFTWAPTSPDIGEIVIFQISGVPGELDEATWSFGGPGCEGYSTPLTCSPGFTDCKSEAYKYASSGTKTVSLSIKVGGEPFSTPSKAITVASTGSCSGTTTCAYSLSPTSRSHTSSAGTGTFAVNDTGGAGCAWSASEGESWITITGGASGSGTGTVAYSITQNSGSSRSGTIGVTYSGGSRSFTVSQSGVAAVDFTISDATPDIGQTVTFAADPSTTPESWDFGGANCAGEGGEVSCSFLGDLCRNFEWAYAEAGAKTVIYESTQGIVEKTLTVSTAGECAGTTCDYDAKPDTSFTMNPNPAVIGEAVTFTDASSEQKGIKVAAIGLQFEPASPEIGELVTFTITGVGAVDYATWSFGGAGCGSYGNYTCEPFASITCLLDTYKFATSGNHTVSVTTNAGTAQTTVPVQSTGECESSTPTCTYSVSPTSQSFAASGGDGAFAVTTQSTCAWNATASRDWIQITAGASGTGAGTVSYSVAANGGGARSGSLSAGGRTHSVSQAAAEGGGGGNAPTSWQWTISRGGTTVKSSSSSVFSYTFDEPGLYDVKLVASNCKGSDTAIQSLEVVEFVQPDDYIMPAAAHTTGLNNTMWKTNLRIFNPGSEEITVYIHFLREATNNTGVNPGIKFDLQSMGTMVIDDVLEVIPGILGDNVQGALRFNFEGGDGTTPVIMSRTFNDTPEGTYGQFVPAVPVLPSSGDQITLTGLVQNQKFRTNVGLANLADTGALGVVVSIFDENGDFLGSRTQNVPPLSTVMLVEASKWVGLVQDLDLYTVYIDPNDNAITAFASMADMGTNDPVLFTQGVLGEQQAYVLGLAHLGGALGSEWRSTVSFHNPFDEALSFEVDYVPEEALTFMPFLSVGLGAGETLHIEDFVGYLLGDDASSKGYVVVKAKESASVPQIAARTYNDTEEGTYGQSLPTYTSGYFIHQGDKGYLPGVANTATKTGGFRSNVALLNIDEDEAAEVRITVFDELGEVLADVPSFTLEPGVFIQDNLFYALGLDHLTVNGSVVIEVLGGGPVIGYASIVDNMTQDPSLVPTFTLPLGR